MKNDIGGDDQYVVASTTNQHHLSSKDKSISLESKRGESTDTGNILIPSCRYYSSLILKHCKLCWYCISIIWLFSDTDNEGYLVASSINLQISASAGVDKQSSLDTTDATPRLKRFDVIREEEDEEAAVNKPMLK